LLERGRDEALVSGGVVSGAEQVASAVSDDQVATSRADQQDLRVDRRQRALPLGALEPARQRCFAHAAGIRVAFA
jgi:hypothetical protein